MQLDGQAITGDSGGDLMKASIAINRLMFKNHTTIRQGTITYDRVQNHMTGYEIIQQGMKLKSEKTYNRSTFQSWWTTMTSKS